MFYLHVPKTGGQTLATRLASAFDPDKVHMFRGDLEFPRDREKLAALLGEKEFIESHVTGAMLSEPMDHPILCTIREPIGQMVSNWRHIRRDSSNRWHRAALSLSAAEFFDNLGDYFRNHQTNYVISSFVQLKSWSIALDIIVRSTSTCRPASIGYGGSCRPSRLTSSSTFGLRKQSDKRQIGRRRSTSRRPKPATGMGRTPQFAPDRISTRSTSCCTR